MDMLIIAATEAEIRPLMTWLQQTSTATAPLQFARRSHRLHIVLTGVGSVAATYHLTEAVHHYPYHLIIQAGIAGSFRDSLALGEVVITEQEFFGDMGAEDNEEFRDIFELGLADPDSPPFSGGGLPNPFLNKLITPSLKKVRGLTVNRVSGNAATIRALLQRFDPDIETMEGAAFHYVCLQQQLAFLQLRSISNYVTVRDRSHWNIPLAVHHLNEQLIQYITTLPED